MNFDPRKLQPDDIRVNPELYHLVQAALKVAGEQELKNFDPINNKSPQKIKHDIVNLRLQIIAEYQARKALDGAK